MLTFDRFAVETVLTALLRVIISVSPDHFYGLFIDRLQLSFEQESANLLAADRLVRSDDTYSRAEWTLREPNSALQLRHIERLLFIHYEICR